MTPIIRASAHETVITIVQKGKEREEEGKQKKIKMKRTTLKLEHEIMKSQFYA